MAYIDQEYKKIIHMSYASKIESNKKIVTT